MKIALLGYGKMGKAIDEIIEKEFAGQHEIGMRITQSNRKTPDYYNNLKKMDVAIDFSVPSAATENILSCFEAGIPVIIGTTGWLDKLEAVKKQCEVYKGTLVYASNFSVGVNIFFEVNRILAKLMSNHIQYRPGIEETHHIHKIDSPSGTAITLAEAILEAIPSFKKWINHDTEKPEELPVVSYRKDEVKGTHLVAYHSEVDSIELKHTAHSRYGFAIGAIKAAEWSMGKKGVFTMRDVLDL
ncbi:MAG: 4-hydroxy-tetrahydrodipicolinate reductase [Sphingobacteriales bacterium]|nr:MAG: 4-hydroxy-tetrahydrodipicolinate reductase [Sphingobacteriales bacterium]